MSPPTMLLDGMANQLLPARFVRNIQLEEFDGRVLASCSRTIQVDANHPRTFAGEKLGGRFSHALRRPGDDDNLARHPPGPR